MNKKIINKITNRYYWVRKRVKARAAPLLLAGCILVGSVSVPYMTAKAIALPEIVYYSCYDLIYSLMVSMGIAVTPVVDEDGGSKAFGKAAYDEFVTDTLDMWAAQNFGTTDKEEIKQQLLDLPKTIKNGVMTISKDAWEALCTFFNQLCGTSYADPAADGIDPSLTGEDLVRAYCEQIFHFDTYYIPMVAEYGSILKFTVGATNYYYFTNKSNVYYYSYRPAVYQTFSNGDIWKYRVEGYGVYENGQIFGWSPATSFFYYDTRYGHYTRESCLIYDASLSMSYEWIYKGEKFGELAPDVIWPKTDLAVDKVITPSQTIEDAVASDVISITEDGAIAIPIENTAVGEDVYEDSIPGVIVRPSEKPAETEKESEKDTEKVDPDKPDPLPPASIGDFPNILDKFPFCIPGDIVRLLRGSRASAKAPVWTFEYTFKQINYTWKFTVDLSDYEKYVKIFRDGFAIFFLIGLVFLSIRISQIFI